MPDLNLSRMVQSILLDGPLPAKLLAREIGKSYTTLLREANPYDTSAKLGLETFFDILQATGQVAPLAYMAEQLGYELRPAAQVHGAKEEERAKAS